MCIRIVEKHRTGEDYKVIGYFESRQAAILRLYWIDDQVDDGGLNHQRAQEILAQVSLLDAWMTCDCRQHEGISPVLIVRPGENGLYRMARANKYGAHDPGCLFSTRVRADPGTAAQKAGVVAVPVAD